ncbi:MAG TPA: bifunctional methionine sulfoxide reductase B/A protein [Myxococcales bacterium]|nr:bifunctional methionine sulfoxide reductase B/A protein [Myxococcales bacterium]
MWAQARPPQKQSQTAGKGNWKTLSKEAKRVVEGCGTEAPFSGKFLKHKAHGTYTCTRCNAPLFSSETKFNSGSGWPSFDDAIPGAVKEVRDSDGRRTEIQCARCGGHLGHVFRGERMTSRNTRHCVNSVSLGFENGPREEAFFAGGCFWGVEHLLESQPGVLDVQSGYMGGQIQAPTYKQVCTEDTGHVEAVRVIFDPTKTTYKSLAQRFFEIHDPTQVDRQGPDRGKQYRSAVFVTGEKQAAVSKLLIARLQAKGLRVATTIEPAGKFWPAEDYHQDYYKRTGKEPYCHSFTPRF